MPRYPHDLLTDDESIVLELRPHWRVLIPSALWLVLGVGAVLVVWTQFEARPSWLLPAVSLVSLVFVLGLAVPPVVNWLVTNYVLTTERIIVRSGIVARTGTEIPLESVNSVHFSQRFVERALGYGDVMLESAGEYGQQRIRNVPDPERFKSQVYAARESRTMHFSGQGTTAAPRDTVAQLESLADLRDRGAITDEEYEAQKQRLLGGDPAP